MQRPKRSGTGLNAKVHQQRFKGKGQTVRLNSKGLKVQPRRAGRQNGANSPCGRRCSQLSLADDSTHSHSESLSVVTGGRLAVAQLAVTAAAVLTDSVTTSPEHHVVVISNVKVRE